MTANPFSAEPPRKKPAIWKKILAWVAIVLGGLSILGNTIDASFLQALSGFLVGMAIILPGVWFILHTRREKKGIAPMKRHWKRITLASLALFFIASFVSPDESSVENTTEPAESSTPVPTSSTTSTKPTSSTETTITSTETTPPTLTTETPAPLPTFEEQEENNVDIHRFAPPAPAPEVTYEEQPAYEEAPAPAPTPAYSGGGSGRTCAEIGHKVYVGDPDYSLDRDSNGDGVGCESYPG